ncbi:MAG: ABC transporter ATP-binding protein, partial [Oscillospiraceae bacterium]|nr:ABC transporter ATP-binding protein [Oscillospiraceae bacterium]
LHLYKPTAGEVWFDGKQVKTKKDIMEYRKKTAMVFQDPYSSLNPRMTVSDIIAEPLDVTIQAQILELMQKLQKELGMAIIMITHDLGVVAQMCDEVIVMYAGSICEQGTADEIFYNPKHEYTKGLMRSIPTVDSDGGRLQPITGTPIDLLNMPKGCPFAPRCENAMKICLRERCERMQINEDHAAACWMNVKEQKGGDR